MVSRTYARPGLLIYDGGCSFCSSCVRTLERLLPVPPRTVPYQSAALGDHGLTVEDARERVWLVTPRRQYGGSAAIAALLRHQPDPAWRWLGWLADTPPWSWAAAGGYAFVARYRHLMPGGTPSCQLGE